MFSFIHIGQFPDVVHLERAFYDAAILTIPRFQPLYQFRTAVRETPSLGRQVNTPEGDGLAPHIFQAVDGKYMAFEVALSHQCVRASMLHAVGRFCYC